MLEFWSVWNFNWWLASQLKLVPLDYSLATSIVGTSFITGSLMGSFITIGIDKKTK